MGKCSFHASKLSHGVSQGGRGRSWPSPPPPAAALGPSCFLPPSLRLMQLGQAAAVAVEGARDLLPGALLGGSRTASG